MRPVSHISNYESWWSLWSGVISARFTSSSPGRIFDTYSFFSCWNIFGNLSIFQLLRCVWAGLWQAELVSQSESAALSLSPGPAQAAQPGLYNVGQWHQPAPAQHQWPWASLHQSEAKIWPQLTNERPGEGRPLAPGRRPDQAQPLSERGCCWTHRGWAGGQTGDEDHSLDHWSQINMSWTYQNRDQSGVPLQMIY